MDVITYLAHEEKVKIKVCVNWKRIYKDNSLNRTPKGAGIIDPMYF
jgi:hypothetical protein